jgi:hypothetical protein
VSRPDQGRTMMTTRATVLAGRPHPR